MKTNEKKDLLENRLEFKLNQLCKQWLAFECGVETAPGFLFCLQTSVFWAMTSSFVSFLSVRTLVKTWAVERRVSAVPLLGIKSAPSFLTSKWLRHCAFHLRIHMVCVRISRMCTCFKAINGEWVVLECSPHLDRNYTDWNTYLLFISQVKSGLFSYLILSHQMG